MEQCGLGAAQQDGQTLAAGPSPCVQTKHEIELTSAKYFPRSAFALCEVAFASIFLQVFLTKEEQLRSVAYEKNSDRVGIIHLSPEIISNWFSPNKPDPVSHDPHQQYDPPKRQLNSHPKFQSLKAPPLRENLRSGHKHDI